MGAGGTTVRISNDEETAAIGEDSMKASCCVKPTEGANARSATVKK